MPWRLAVLVTVLHVECPASLAENVNLDVILSEALSVLPETELLKPLSNLLHRREATVCKEAYPRPRGSPR
jgi:hypothetical protein